MGKASILSKLSKRSFHLILIIVLAGIFFQQAIMPLASTPPANKVEELNTASVDVFYHPDCPHCAEEMAFLETLKQKYPTLVIATHNIANEDALALLLGYAEEHHIPIHTLGTPFLIIGERYLVGFDDTSTTGQIIEQWVNEFLEEPASEETTKREAEHIVHLPFFGDTDVLKTSLPVLAIIMGLVDGFNPCAMWVLIYLLSLIADIKDRSRMVLLVGTFLFASGTLYFLFMTAWLNIFLWIGYIRILTILIGLAAIYMGALTIREFILTQGQVICKVGNIQSRQKTISSIRKLVTSPLSIATFAGIITLAFAVNSIEFVCSSALPAIFTHVLAISDLSPLLYYGYILLYVFFLMLDDLIIFTLAVLALGRFAEEKYAGYCHLFGGMILAGLGTILTFFPEIMR